MPLIWQGITQSKIRSTIMFSIKAVKVTLSKINSDLVSFKCNSSLSGFVHIPDDGAVTVVFDGGYEFGTYHCPECAVQAISFLCFEIEEAEKKSGMNYQAYKSAFAAG